MKKIAYSWIFTCVIGVAVGQKEIAPMVGAPKDFKIPEKKVNTLSNGLQSTLVPYGIVPKVTVQIIVKTGNVHETENEVGLADVTADMLREGTTTMNSKAIAEKIASMGGEINSYAAMDQFGIYATVLSEFAPEVIKVMADMLINPVFPETELARIKNDLKRNLSIQKTRPQNIANEKFFSAIYQDHPYGRFFPTEQMIDGFTLDQVKNFFTKNFGAKRTVIYVVGKYNEQLTQEAIKNSFGSWREGPDIFFPEAKETSTKEISILDRPNAPQTTIMIGAPTLTPRNPDFQALAVTNSLLGGSFGSRITQNIREDKGYTYSPFSSIQNRHGTSVWYEQADVTSEHTGDALFEIGKEIKHLQTEAPSLEELKGIQNYSSGIFVLQNSNPFGIIGQLNYMDQHDLPDSYLENYVTNIYAVTPEKVKQLANDYFKYEDMTIVLVGDKKLLDEQIQSERNRIKKQ
jgi:zinc protease